MEPSHGFPRSHAARARRRRLARRWTPIAIAAFLLLLPAGVARATLLVRMQNGRVLRAQSVEHQDGWLLATLDGNNVIGFPESAVEVVEEDKLGDQADASGPSNIVTSGRYIPPPGRTLPFPPPVREEVPRAPRPPAQAPGQTGQDLTHPVGPNGQPVVDPAIRLNQHRLGLRARQDPGKR